MRLNSSAVTVLATVLLLLVGNEAQPQAPAFWIAGTGDWDTPNNWDTAPDAPPLALFGEFGVISNDGTAFIDGASQPTGGIVLGNAGGESGFLEIRSGGSIDVQSNLGTTGEVQVGNNGTGGLMVSRGGTLTTLGLATAGGSNTLLTLGETGGAGSATVSVNGLTEFDRMTRIVGPNVSFDTVGLVLGTGNVLIAEITGIPHSTISATGNATLGGTLQLAFNGHTPQVGDFWDIIDAAGLSGDWATVEPAVGSNLPAGVGLIPSQVPNAGVNGNLARVTVGSKLVLTVNRNTGSANMGNLAGGMIEFDSYEISSPGGFLNSGNWNSLEDQAETGWLEIGSPSSNLLAELNPENSSVVSGGQSFDLGAVFDFTPTEFGQSGDDLTFKYSLANGGVIDGIVEYEGGVNNLVVRVDPLTGEAGIENQSTFNVTIDGYEIRSLGGSLQPGDGDWLSLEDAGEPGWLEIGTPTSNLLAELLPTGSMQVSSGQFISLGEPFAIGGQQDLEFAFSISGGDIINGVVQYGSLPVGLNCDFDGGGCGLSDIDMLVMELAAGGNNLAFDVNGDNVIDDQDLSDWLLAAGEANLGPGRSYLVGDANLDGVVDVPDFNIWNGSKFTVTGKWSQGDFNADGVTDVPDFNVWNGNKFTSSDGVSTVPEPSALTLLLCCSAIWARLSVRRERRLG